MLGLECSLVLDSLEDGVGVQVDTHHVRGGVVQVEVAGVDAYDEGHGCQQHVGHLQRAQGDVGAEPAEREAHLDTKEHESDTDRNKAEPWVLMQVPVLQPHETLNRLFRL